MGFLMERAMGMMRCVGLRIGGCQGPGAWFSGVWCACPWHDPFFQERFAWGQRLGEMGVVSFELALGLFWILANHRNNALGPR